MNSGPGIAGYGEENGSEFVASAGEYMSPYWKEVSLLYTYIETICGCIYPQMSEWTGK